MAGPLQKLFADHYKKKGSRGTRAYAGIEVKDTPALSGGALTWTLRTRQFLLPVKAYGLASACAMRCVTGTCDVSHQRRKGRGLAQIPFF